MLAHQGGATPEPGSAPGAVRASFGLYNDEADVDRLIEGVSVLRDRRWVGRYRVRATGVTAEFAGRCNDRWMEADAPAPTTATSHFRPATRPRVRSAAGRPTTARPPGGEPT